MKQTEIKQTTLQQKIGYIGVSMSASLGFLMVGLLFSPLLIGIPIALFGIFLFFASPVLGWKSRKVECPECHRMNMVITQTSIKCKDCKKRILIGGMIARLVI